MSTTVGETLAAALAKLGVRRVWGRPPTSLPMESIPVADDNLALLLAEADGRINGGFGAAWLAGSILHLSNRPGGTSSLTSIDSLETLAEILVELDPRHPPSAAGFKVELDLAATADSGPLDPMWQRSVVATLDPAMANLRFAILAGPGVVRADAQPALHELAATLGCGVVNTWGAKGVFRWDSPFHFGTAGLQERDFDLAGLADADVVVSTGIDPDESPSAVLTDLDVIEVDPAQLAALTYRWEARGSPPESPPELYRSLSAVVTPLYERDSGPIAPPRAALHLSGARPERGVVVADAGVAGYWVARTFPTGEVGSVIVPATRQPGFAIAAAHVAALDGRHAIAVCDSIGDEAASLLELSAERGVGYGVQVWSGADDVEATGDNVPRCATPDDHVEVTLAGFDLAGFDLAGRQARPLVTQVTIDESPIQSMIDAAGPVVAWGGF